MVVDNERRKYPRVKARVPISCRLVMGNSSMSGNISSSDDLSKNGISFKLNNFVSKSSRMVIELKIPKMRVLKVIAKVAWISRSSSDDRFLIGSQFLEMTNENRQILSGFLDKESMALAGN